MAEVICEEYGQEIPQRPVPIFLQAGHNWYDGVDKDIMRRADVFPHAAINNVSKLDELTDYIKWTKNRIQSLAGNDYIPRLHYDLYATLGIKYDNDIDKIIRQLQIWEDTAKPYDLTIEEPVDMKSKDRQIETMSKLIRAKNKAGISALICADEWCNTLEDTKDFVQGGAADMIQIKAPDLGGINNSIEAILFCKRNNVKAYLGGSCSETDISAKVCWHIALATQPFQTLSKPGLGVDESNQIAVNEMRRTLALIRRRQKA
jgi:methylaspartate ammonia-lyase